MLIHLKRGGGLVVGILIDVNDADLIAVTLPPPSSRSVCSNAVMECIGSEYIGSMKFGSRGFCPCDIICELHAMAAYMVV
jgi:hypothetical protein